MEAPRACRYTRLTHLLQDFFIVFNKLSTIFLYIIVYHAIEGLRCKEIQVLPMARAKRAILGTIL